MGFFDDKKLKERIEYLENERKKLWDRLTKLEHAHFELKGDVARKTTDDEKEAAQSSKKAAEYRNKAEQRLDEATVFVNSIKDAVDSAALKIGEINSIKDSLDITHSEAIDIKEKIEFIDSDLYEKCKTLDRKIKTFNDFFELYPDLDAELEVVTGNLQKITENVNKSNVSVSSINKRKQEIDELVTEIFGYTDEDEDGNQTKVEGIKEQLEDSYTELKEKLDGAFDTIKNLSEQSHKSYSDFENKHKEKYDSIQNEIESLLPAAMTAGLSSAFSTKKKEEESSAESLQRKFRDGIYFLIGVSLLPFIVSSYFLYTNIPLNEVINRLPRLVLAIIPMYIPVLWFTYSANKKLNLSKRLIEEYSHKEVLSKTYEGLSKQIGGLSNDEQALELKYRLLSNFLQVSSENPGKLISNYEASDHPVMEALEQSYKFQVALDKLDGVPGLGKIAAIVESKAKRKIERKEETITRALDEVENSGEF